jgi:hypothetical protein
MHLCHNFDFPKEGVTSTGIFITNVWRKPNCIATKAKENTLVMACKNKNQSNLHRARITSSGKSTQGSRSEHELKATAPTCGFSRSKPCQREVEFGSAGMTISSTVPL